MRGDMTIQGLWDPQANAIIDIKLGDSEVDYYKYEQIVALLNWWERIKKDKYGNHCHDQHKIILQLFILFTAC